MADCIFCKIINKEVPSKIVYEDEKFIAFKDIAPKAPIHLLIVPKKHIPSVNHLKAGDKELMAEIFLVAQKIAKDYNPPSPAKVSKGNLGGQATSSRLRRAPKKLKGYKLVINVGREGGQLIDHLHLHLLSGKLIQLP